MDYKYHELDKSIGRQINAELRREGITSYPVKCRDCDGAGCEHCDGGYYELAVGD